jgi:hypothetical protein
MQSVALDIRRRPRPLKSARLIGLRLAVHDATMFSFRRTCRRGKIDRKAHPVDAATRPVLRQAVPRIEHHVLAVVQLILRQKTPLLNGNASSMEKSSRTSSPDLCVAGPDPSQVGSFDHFVGVGE